MLLVIEPFPVLQPPHYGLQASGGFAFFTQNLLPSLYPAHHLPSRRAVHRENPRIRAGHGRGERGGGVQPIDHLATSFLPGHGPIGGD